MNSIERRATTALSAIYALRMVGLFMLLPVLSLHLDGFAGSPALIGLAIGIYGFSQALLQIPFGLLSDRIGRKPVILFGLLLFACGSVVAATADSTMEIIVGRALQGSGAIASSIMALLADLTREEERTKAMAVIGMTIGASYMASLVVGPVLAGVVGVSGLFWLTAFAALVMMVILLWWVPKAPRSHHRDVQPVPAQFAEIAADRQLLRLDLSIFMLHAVMTANFVVLPLMLRDQTGLAVESHWLLYLGVVSASIFLMVPMIIVAERHRRMKQIFLISIALLAVAQCGLWLGAGQLWMVALSLFLFFVGFNVLEASLPSLISKAAPVTSKGTALGVYSTAQFLGAFAGGALGGLLLAKGGMALLFGVSMVSILVWWLIAATMTPPPHLLTRMVNLGNIDEQQVGELTARFLQLEGVAEAVLVPADGIAYLKVDSRQFSADALLAMAAQLRR